jgi:hypothetical protein
VNAERQIFQAVGQVEAMARDVFAAVVLEAHRSIQTGSELTGSPGQPVDTGALLRSWMIEFEGPEFAAITSNMEYAQMIEDGLGKYGPITIRSAVGGSHSLELTALGIPRIIEVVTQRMALSREGFINERTGFVGEQGG